MLGSVYGSLFYDLVSENTAFLVTLSCEILCTIVCVPLLFGYAGVCIRLIRGEDCPISELFAPYASLSNLLGVYAFLVKTIPALLFKIILPVLGLSYLYYELDYFTDKFAGTELEIHVAGIKSIYFIPAILFLLICMLWFGKNISDFLVFCNGNASFAGIKSRYFAFLRLRLSLIPLYALSFLTFGILFIAYTVPLTVIIYSLFLRLDEYAQDEPQVGDVSVNTSHSFEVGGIYADNAPKHNDDLSSKTENIGDTAVFDINNFDNN